MQWLFAIIFSLIFLLFSYAPASAVDRAAEAPSQRAHKGESQYQNIVSSVVCELTGDDSAARETVTVMVEPAQDFESACPDGSRYIGHYVGDKFVEELWGIPVPPESPFGNDTDNSKP